MADELSRTLTSYLDEIISGGVHEPAEIAEQAMSKVPREVFDIHLRAFLCDAARHRLSRRRAMNPLISGPNSGYGEHPAYRAERAEVSSTDSPTVRRIRDAETRRVAALLADDVFDGATHHQLGEMGLAELMGAAAHMRVQAARDMARAERYEKIAAALEEHGAATVAKLPRAVLLALAEE